jgi:imidazolonepropionase-like amidohydrolase
LVEITAIRATRDFQEVGEYTPDVNSWIAVNPDSELLGVTRAAGISHFQPVPRGGVVAGQSALMALDGWTPEQMAVRSPIGLHVFWPGFQLDTTPRESARDRSKWKSLEAQAKERRAKVRALEDFFEEARAFAKAKDAAAKGSAVDPRRNPSWEAMLPFARRDLPLVIHANEVRQIRSAVDWATTNGYPMILAGGRDAWMLTDLLVEKKIPVIYENIFTQPVRDTDRYDVHFRAPAVLHEAGVKVVISTGADSASLVKNLPHHAAHAMAFGLPEAEALKSMTLYAAQLAGVADRLGSIEAGKEASLFVSDRDILDVRANVQRMWIAGREVSLDNRHTRLYDKYRNRPAPR